MNSSPGKKPGASAPGAERLSVLASTTIAALYVQPRGVYFDLPGVEPWGLPDRDARLYTGPHPVVAHPPCGRWSVLAYINQKRYGHKVGDDGGCFAAALAAVRAFGGVLEHPAQSAAWAAFDLPVPPRDGGWVRGLCGGWSCHVEQGHYGHPARKATWLYAYGVVPPSLRWGPTPEASISATVGWAWSEPGVGLPRITKAAASCTPVEFRDLLLEIARTVTPLSPAVRGIRRTSAAGENR